MDAYTMGEPYRPVVIADHAALGLVLVKDNDSETATVVNVHYCTFVVLMSDLTNVRNA